MLCRDLGNDRQHARCRSKEQKERHAGKANRTTSHEHRRTRSSEPTDEERRNCDRRQLDRPPVVVEHERRWKDRETHVVSEHTQLRDQVAPPWPFGKAESDSVRPVSACDNDGQHDPRCRESRVEDPSAPQQRWPRTSVFGKDHVPRQHYERRGDHGLLAGHTKSAGHHGSHDPSAIAIPRSNTAVQRQQQTQPHQRLGPLDEIGDRRRRERMDAPEHCRATSKCRGVASDHIVRGKGD